MCIGGNAIRDFVKNLGLGCVTEQQMKIKAVCVLNKVLDRQQQEATDRKAFTICCWI